MLTIGINGFGRIGRAIYRANLLTDNFKVALVNDINPDKDNLAYQLNYDTLYGQLDEKFVIDGQCAYSNQQSFAISHYNEINAAPWDEHHVDIVVDASGVKSNVDLCHDLIKQTHVKKAVITHSPDNVDFTMVLGANEQQLDLKVHHVISSSICDATAIGPVLKIINENFGLISGHLTTLHPWLSYQNLMDGPASSWSVPGEIYHHFALGRSSIGNLIPKPTSALAASLKVVNDIDEKSIGSYSIRTPTQIVGCADLTLTLKKSTTEQDILAVFEAFAAAQTWPIINNNVDPLVSLDFQRSKYSANVDHRFTSLVRGNLLKLVLWYDNEWGYATRVCDQLNYIHSRF